LKYYVVKGDTPFISDLARPTIFLVPFTQCEPV
jgi:hypothetical protein